MLLPHVKFECRFLGKVFVTDITLVLASPLVFIKHDNVGTRYTAQIWLLLDCWHLLLDIRLLEHHLICNHMVS